MNWSKLVGLYVKQHPLLVLEHSIVVFAVISWVISTQKVVTPADKCRHTPVSWPEMPPFVLHQNDVQEAPGATMTNANLSEPGQIMKHRDARGDIFRLSMGEGVIVNTLHSTAGTMRSGDVHNCTQFDVILRGRTRLHLKNLGSGEEVVHEYEGNNDFIAIPPRVAHLFEFVEDNFMVEWWACDFRAWYYAPYRERIQEAFRRWNELLP